METVNIETPAIQDEGRSPFSSRRTALALGGAALAGLALARPRRAFAQATIGDPDILNFALNLEYLEAQFYTLATQGVTIDKVGVPIIGGSGAAGGTVTVKPTSTVVPFTTPLLQQYAMETATEEVNHVLFLQKALGTAYVAMPNIDLLNSVRPSIPSPARPTSCSALLSSRTLASPPITARRG